MENLSSEPFGPVSRFGGRSAPQNECKPVAMHLSCHHGTPVTFACQKASKNNGEVTFRHEQDLKMPLCVPNDKRVGMETEKVQCNLLSLLSVVLGKMKKKCSVVVPACTSLRERRSNPTNVFLAFFSQALVPN